MSPSTYVARQPGPFSALLQARTLGGYLLQALPPRRVSDRYEDTDDGALLAQGLTLRLREQEGEWSAALRPIRRGPDAPEPVEAAFGVAWTPPDGPLPLPPGPLADAVRRVVGTDTVAPLLRLRQFRTPRLVYDGDRLVALLSFDVVVYEVPSANVVSNELEVKLAQDGVQNDLFRLDPVLRDHGLEPVALSKLERGVLRLHRGLDEPILLLPDERAALDGLQALANPMLRRRARVVLLDARGFRTLTIAGQVGLSTARVRHWQQRFREERMAIFEAEDAVDTPPARVVPAYRISEIVDRGDGSAPPADEAPATSVGDGSPSQAPFAEGPTVTPTATPARPDPPVSDPPAAEPSHPDAPSPPGPLQDMGALLEFFQPSDPGTPLLGDDPDEDLGGEDRAAEAEPPADASDVQGLAASTEPLVGKALDPREASTPEPPRGEARSGASHRRAFLAPDTPILTAAHDTLAHYVGAYDRAVERFRAEASARSAQRLLLAAHRVRLAIEAFGAYLPAAAAGRLVAVLRPLAASLDLVVELERVLDAGVGAAATARDEALDAARRHLTADRHRVWSERAGRLVGRLAEQIGSGLLIGDDFPVPQDDWVGRLGDRPMPSRLRHILASVVWARYESVRAFEDEVDDGLSPLTAHHLAVAVSGLHFALGLASKASDASAVREAAAHLDAAERVVAAFRTATRGRTGTTTAADVRGAWASLEESAFRQLLGTVTAAI